MTLPSDFGECVERLRRTTVLIGDGGKSGSGSGVILDAGGTIATNAHVVRSPRVRVQLHDGTVHNAMLRAHDRNRDLALLAIAGSGLPAAVMGDSRALGPGALVVAVGNPFGFLGAVTVGVVRRAGTVRGLGPAEWIQSDLRLAPGNSGGPLANAAGEVVGLNAMIAGGLALAVPAEALKNFMAEGESRATLGVALRTVNVTVRGGVRTGLCILDIAGGSPAEAASLMPGDIVIGVNDAPVGSPDDLIESLQGRAERVMRIQFLRGDRSTLRTASVLLGSPRSRAA